MNLRVCSVFMEQSITLLYWLLRIIISPNFDACTILFSSYFLCAEHVPTCCVFWLFVQFYFLPTSCVTKMDLFSYFLCAEHGLVSSSWLKGCFSERVVINKVLKEPKMKQKPCSWFWNSFLPINWGASNRSKCSHGMTRENCNYPATAKKCFQENRNNCPQRRNHSIFSPRNLIK